MKLSYNTKFQTNKWVGIFLFLGIALATSGQQMPRFSQYTMNEFLLNPATAGADGLTTLNLTARKEWLGFSKDSKTPETFSLSLQSRLLKKRSHISKTNKGNKRQESSKGRVGLGGALFSDFNGAMRRSGLQVSYAYHIYAQNTQFSFGITGSICQLKFDKNYLDFYDNNNEVMLSVTSSPSWIPDFNAGINIMTQNFHIGASVAQVFQSPFIFGNPDIDYQSSKLGYKRIYFLISDYRIRIEQSDWEIEPSILLKTYDLLNFKSGTYGPGSQLDITMKLFYLRKFWFGASYRTPADMIVFGGIKYNNLYVGYAFDYGLNDLSKNSYGSHEITISSRFGDTSRRYRWLDRY